MSGDFRSPIGNRLGEVQGYKPPVNGCGDKSWKGKLVPNRPAGGADFEEACNKHDTCYGTCGADKAKCDKDFMDNMEGACILKYGLMQVDFGSDPFFEFKKWRAQRNIERCTGVA